MKKQPDHREQPRYHVRTGVGAALDKSILGTIISINNDGFTLSCFDARSEDEKYQPDPLQLSIAHEDEFLLENIPCKIVGEDCPRSHTFSGPVTINQYHVEFAQLTSEQKSRLEYFLDYFTDKRIAK